jgi:hypothetical protein
MKPIRKLPANFYCSGNGHEPVREWLKSLDSADRKTIGEDKKTQQTPHSDLELAIKRWKEWKHEQGQ